MEATPTKSADDLGLDPMNMLVNKDIKPSKYSSEALRMAIGEARMNQVLQSVSMGVIPTVKSGNSFKNAVSDIQKAQSMQFGKSLSFQLENLLQKRQEK